MDSRVFPCKEQVDTSESDLFGPSPSCGPCKGRSVVAGDAPVLLIKEEAKAEELRQTIAQSLQIPTLRTVTPKDAIEVCNTEFFLMIWVYISTPLQEEILNLVSSIRCSGKKNKNAYIIAVAETQPEVDLHLRGFDEIYLQPLSMETIQQKYPKFRLSNSSAGNAGPDDAALLRDATATPESTISLESVKTTECSQSSVCDSVSSGADVNELGFPDLKSTLSVPTSHKPQSPYLTDSMQESSPVAEPASPLSWCRVEHATKEKQRRSGSQTIRVFSIRKQVPAHTEKRRRERIKDSCDQLRVLLPYVRGRKTDMASILEMTVDYLKIVNAALPQEFQSQVIEIMSNGSPVLEGRISEMKRMNMASKRMNKRGTLSVDDSPHRKALQIVDKPNLQTLTLCANDQNSNNRMVTRSLSRAVTSTVTETDNPVANSVSAALKFCSTNVTTTASVNGIVVPKREFPSSTKTWSSRAKRPHMAFLSTMEEGQASSVVYVPTGTVTPIKETKKENLFDEIPSQGHPFTNVQFPQMFTGGDISANRMFSTGHMASTNDLFPYQTHTHINSSGPPRLGASDRTDNIATFGGMYLDDAFYHYYPSLQESDSGNFFVPGGTNEYVNPNAVLPITSFTPRVATLAAGRKLDRSTSSEVEHFGVSDSSDLFSSNCSASTLKSNSS